MKLIGCYTNCGQNIGVIMSDAISSRIPGDIGNAMSYPNIPPISCGFFAAF